MGPRERHSRHRSKTHMLPIVIGSFFGFFLLFCVAFGIGMIGNVNRWLSDLPDYTDADNYMVSEPTSILDANGNEIASLYVQNRESVTYDQISPYVLQGTVSTEDERFYQHNGVDILGIMRAVVVQLTGGSEGASTITQQLVRNTILSEEQFDNTIERKVREAWIAIQMEKIFSKEEILTMYLNPIYYGHGAYGIQAAAQTYFSKNASDLTLAEAALLVGLPNAPSQYDPTVNPDLAVQRRNIVLSRMVRNGVISQEEAEAIAALDAGDAQAKALLIEHNLRLVVYIARRFENTGVNIEDLISIGTIGLIKAINTFNSGKAIKLATYASRCIENEILMYLRKNNAVRGEISIDEPLNTDYDGNELLLSDILGTDADEVIRPLEDDADREMLRIAIDTLPEREKQIILLRYGFIGGTEYTQKEVASLLGISQSYISRLEKRIIERLHSEMLKLAQ